MNDATAGAPEAEVELRRRCGKEVVPANGVTIVHLPPSVRLHFFVGFDSLCEIGLSTFELLCGLVLQRVSSTRARVIARRVAHLVCGDEVVAVHSGGNGSLVQAAADELHHSHYNETTFGCNAGPVSPEEQPFARWRPAWQRGRASSSGSSCLPMN